MAYFGYADRLLLCYAPGIAYLYLLVAGDSGDARAAARARLIVRNAVAAAVALIIFLVARAMAIANRKNMDIVRWKLVLLRGLLLLVVGLNAFSCFIAIDIYLGGGGDSSAAASSACAIVAVTMYLRLWWVAVHVYGV